MRAAVEPQRSASRESLKGLPYEDTVAEKPPIPVTVARPTKNAQIKGIIRRAREAQQLSPENTPSKYSNDDVRRDSGLATSSSTTRDSRTTLGTEPESTSSLRQSPSLRVVSPEDEHKPPGTPKTASRPSPESIKNWGAPEKITETGGVVVPQMPFLGILTEIPTGSFEDLTLPGQVEFSKRGSMLIAGQRANRSTSDLVGNGRATGGRREGRNPRLRPPIPSSNPSHSPSPLTIRSLSADDEAQSRRVRSMYRGGTDEQNPGNTRALSQEPVKQGYSDLGPDRGRRDATRLDQDTASASIRESYNPRFSEYTNEHIRTLLREPDELAGGIEDWEDLSGGDVDRYGFIVPRNFSSQPSSMHSTRPMSPEKQQPRLQRVSTLLQLASETPRQNHSHFRNGRSAKSPARSTDANSTRYNGSSTVRPKSSQSSYRSSSAPSRMRFATNRLPHNKDRRCVDEAGDMLTLPPGLADIAEDQDDSRVASKMRKREWNREQKWRKMGRVVNRGDKQGGGMVFEFDTKSPKLIERVWKGIPDKWRATAWHAFLTTSAKRRKIFVEDEKLIQAFRGLLDKSSPDDVQIDNDVPRTINSHIMFRRRYRGGQRLLFRVLHCVSIYFPETGYVQGMAALAATLLCYYDEEMTFVMMVRLWQLRGLDRLYKAGFEGLMQALEEFERDWLRNGDVAAKLVR